MADWSVVGEILGETNLDEVGESVERSLQDAANATQKAAAGSEDMEKAMDSATEAVASLSGASRDADEQLEEVEAEMEDIVTDAGAAAGSVQILNSSLQGIEDVDDLDIDVNTNIDELNESWAKMRNEIDDFEHRFDDIIPRGGGGGAPISDFLGDQREFENAMDTLDNAEDTMQSIADERESAMGGGRGISDPFRRIDTGGDVFRRRLAEGLSPGGGKSVVNAGRLSSTLGGERQAGDLARALSRRSDIGSSFGEALSAVIEAGDFNEAAEEFGRQMADVDRVPALPPGEGIDTPDRFNRRFDTPRTAGTLRGMGVDMSGQIPVDEVMEAEPGAFGEGFVGMQEDLSLRQRGRAIDMGALDFDQLMGGLNEPVTMAQDELREFHERTGDATESSSRLSDALDRASTRVRDAGRRARVRAGGIGEGITGGMTGDIMDMRGGGDGGTARSFRRTREALGDLSEGAVQSNTTLGFMIATMTLASGSARNMEHAVEELDEDVEDLARSLSAAAPAVQNLSANLGPFNVSMSNLLVTIPALIATVGPFIAVLAGLAGAILAVVGAFGALLAVGAIGFVEDLKNNFAEIESTSDALMVIMRGLKEAIIDALAPLEDVEIGGLGAQGIFVTVLRDLVALINMFAEAAAALLNMDVVEDFLLNLRAAVLGFSDATEGGISMIDGLKQMMAGALPVLEGFLIWLIDVFPEFMAFIGEITSEAGPAMAQFANALLRLSVLLTEAGTGAMSVLFPALAMVFDVLSLLLGAMIAFERMLGDVSNVLIAVAGGALFAGAALIKMVSTLDSAFEAAATVTSTLDAMNGAVAESDTVFEAYQKSVRNTNSSMVRFAHLSLVAMGRLIVLAAGLYLVLDALGLLEPLISLVSDNLGPLIDGITDATDAMGNAVGVGDTFTRVIEFMTGTLLLAAFAGSFFTGSMWSAVTAMGGFVTSALGVIGVLSAMITELIINTGGLWGLISAETTATIVTEGFTGAVWSAVASLSALQIVTGVAVVAAIALLASEMLGFTDVIDTTTQAILAAVAAITVAFLGSGWGAIIVAVGLLIAALINLEKVVGPVAAGVIAAIGAITAAFLGSGWGAIIVALGLAAAAIYMLGKRFGWLKVIAIAAIGAITAALVGSGWGAIIVGIGLLLLLLMEYWDELAGAVEGAISWFDNLGPAGKAAIMAILLPLSPLLATLLAVREAIGLILNPQKRQKWWNAIQNGIDGIIDTVKGIIDWVILLFTDPMSALGQLYQSIMRGINNILGRLGGQSGRQGGGDGIQGTGSSVLAGAAAGAAAGSVIPGVGTVTGAVVGGTAGLVDEHVFDLPVLQKGGFIQRSGLAYLHSNEMVVPQHMFADADVNTGAQTGGGRTTATGGTTVNVNIQGDGSDIDDRRARQIGRIARNSVAEQRRYEDGR